VLPLADAPGQPPRIEPQFRDAADASAPSPVVQELYRAAVGEKNLDYYLRQFARFDQAGKTGASWHWPASLSTLNWLAWRGMWSTALAFAALCLTLGLLVFGIGRLVFDFSPTTELILLALCLALVFFLPGLFANAAYYRFSKKRIEAALAASATIDEACASLASQASSNRRWFVLAATNASLVAVIGLFTWLLTSTGSFEASAPTPPSQPVLATAVEPPAASPAARTKASDNMPTPAATPMPAPMPASEPMASAAAAASAPPSPPPPPATLQLADAQPVPARALPARPPASANSAAAPTSPSIPATGAAAVKAGAASAASPAPAATEFRFALQVGAFANEENARKAQAKLQAAGFKAYLEDLETSQGKRIRVRVGPFATRAEAEKAAPQVKALDLPALLVKS
jgi:cell division septation protein DedD